MFSKTKKAKNTKRQSDPLVESLISEIDAIRQRIEKLEENEFVRDNPFGRLVFGSEAGLYFSRAPIVRYEYYYNHNKKAVKIPYRTSHYQLSYAVKIVHNQAYIAFDKEEKNHSVCTVVDLSTGNVLAIANQIDFSEAEWRVAKC